MLFGYLVEYTNVDGQYRTYGGLSHFVQAPDQQAAIAKVRRMLPPQVAATCTTISVRGYL